MQIIKQTLSFIFLLLLIHTAMAQKDTRKYDLLWKKADELALKKGLPKSALAEVNKIYALAKKEKQEGQLIKALLFKIHLAEPGTENAEIKTITALEKEADNATEPARSILSSIVAERYWNYFQQNRWRLYNRTATAAYKKEDIATWGAEDFHQRISEWYLRSVQQETVLKQTRLASIQALVLAGNTPRLRPTLFDLLAHRALAYFINDERDLAQPAYAFKMDGEQAFAPASAFINQPFLTDDTASLHYRALLLYQRLIAFHLPDAKPDALIDADLQRLAFARAHAVRENKEWLYYQAVKRVAEQYRSFPAADQAWYLLARWHADKAAQYNAITDTRNRYEYVTARDICEQVMQRQDSSEGKINCANLLKEIKTREINHTTEKVNVPGKPFRVLVNYRNCTLLHARIIAIDRTLQEKLENRYDDKYWQLLAALKPERQWSQELPDTRDYQLHAAEIKVDALPVGQYALLLGTQEDFSPGKSPLSVQYFYVSDISYVNSGNDYFVLHRQTGKPLANASVQVWKYDYDYTLRKNRNKRLEQYLTDNRGYFRLTDSTNRNIRINLEINHGNDHLFMNDNFYIYYRGEQPDNRNAAQYDRENRRAFLFADRSIYRPGQTIYFKGIAITKDFDSKQNKILAGEKSRIILRNANREDIDTLQLTTNAFGSYSGSFRLPSGAMNGQFQLYDATQNATLYFSVEEYKRPEFFVAYDKLTGSYRVNDSIRVTGQAKAYAGNLLDGARVSYRVVRRPRFIYFWHFKRWPMPPTAEMEITHGEAVTDAEGRFAVVFKAIPDETLDKSLDPVFDYSIIADVTDINGETRSATMAVSVAYKALQLQVQVPGGVSVPADKLDHILVSTTNMNGEFEPAPVTVQLYPLQQPDRLIRSRYWPQPDQFVMTRETYTSLFPHDEYKDESRKENWLKGKLLTALQGSSAKDRRFVLPHTTPAPGWYALEVSATDKYGETVKDIQYILINDTGSHRLPVKEYLSSALLKDSYQPGEAAVINFGSSAEDLTIIEEVVRAQPQGANQPDNRTTLTGITGTLSTAAPGSGRNNRVTLTGTPATGTTPNESGNGVILPTTGNLPAGDQPGDRFRLFTLDNEKKSLAFPVAENDRGGFEVNHLFVKDNRFYISYQHVTVPWTNKELSITYETFRDYTLPGSEEKWKVKISGSQKEKVAAEMLAGMYDASLDQFKPHRWWIPGIWPHSYLQNRWEGNHSFTSLSSESMPWKEPLLYGPVKSYDELISFSTLWFRKRKGIYVQRESKADANVIMDAAPAGQRLEEVVVAGYGTMAKKSITGAVATVTGTEKAEESLPEEDAASAEPATVQVRRNFNETAFFLPDLQTDASGAVTFSFTMPEALTTWKFQALAHTKDLSFGYTTTSLITRKDLMVQPNTPRFLREGDRMELSAKIVNMSDREITGTVHLELFSATTMQPVDGIFQNMNAHQYFTVEAGRSVPAGFTIEVPYHYNDAVVYRLVARAATDSAGNALSDGEEAPLPVLTNSMLVTETLPLPVRGNKIKQFSFEKLLRSGNSETLQQHSLTVEFTANPAWYAVQALPYLMEYPYECSEQTFNRFYANALATAIANASPKLKAVFKQWQTADTAALLSNLQKNPELKSVLLEETPWVLAAKTEAQQKKNIALLFDLVNMERALTTSLDKLTQMQSPNGGFVWFKGGPDDRYITQYIITGIGHLKKLNALPASARQRLDAIVKAAFPYMDNRLQEDYERLVKSGSDLNKNHISHIQIQYLYMRSFFPEAGIPGNVLKAVSYYRKQSQQYWVPQNNYMKGMIALQLFRSGDKQTAGAILKSLRENAVTHEEMGMYWKNNRAGYYWQEAPIETQSLLIEAFAEINQDARITDDLKTWLLKQKQTNNWGSTKASADACYALLLQGSDWLEETPVVTIQLGDKIISSDAMNTPGAELRTSEAGTGYFKTRIDAPFIKPEMGNISVQVTTADTSSTRPAWGAVYWQYFEQLDKITPSASPLALSKQLFVEKNSDRGPVLYPVTEGGLLAVGDKIKVRIELRADREMEYVHIKDMRASCMEPVNVLSSYKWQGGLGYYESTKDASTNFFFSQLPKGTHVFEYPLLVTAAGNFSNGVTSVQCMYAPEFSSHSEGVRVTVK